MPNNTHKYYTHKRRNIHGVRIIGPVAIRRLRSVATSGWGSPLRATDCYLTDEVQPNDDPYILLWSDYTEDDGLPARDLFAVSNNGVVPCHYCWPYRKTKAPKIKTDIEYYHVILKRPYIEYEIPQEFKTAIRKWSRQVDNGTI